MVSEKKTAAILAWDCRKACWWPGNIPVSAKCHESACLALGGLFISTPKPPPNGDIIQLIFEVPGGDVRARALVRDSQPGKGMGVEFTAMGQEARARLNQLMKVLTRTEFDRLSLREDEGFKHVGARLLIGSNDLQQVGYRNHSQVTALILPQPANETRRFFPSSADIRREELPVAPPGVRAS